MSALSTQLTFLRVIATESASSAHAPNGRAETRRKTRGSPARRRRPAPRPPPVGGPCPPSGDPERPQPPVGLGDVRPVRRPRPVSAPVDPAVQIPEVSLQVLAVAAPPHVVHPRRGPRDGSPGRPPQAVDRDMMQERGEPRNLVLARHSAHATKRTQRALPGSASGARFAGRVFPRPIPFPPPPPQPAHRRCSAASQVLRDRQTSHGRASRAHRLSVSLTARHRADLPPRTPIGGASSGSGGRPWDLPVLAHGASRACTGSSPAGSADDSRPSASGGVAFRLNERRRHPGQL